MPPRPWIVKFLMPRALLIGLLAPVAAGPVWAQRQTATAGNLELHAEAVASRSLTPEAAANYRVEPAADRGVLLVTVLRRERGNAVTVPAQVYAGAMSRRNHVLSIPLREVREDKAVYYVGEFRYTAPDELRFLVNANVLGTPLKAEFSRAFPVD